MGASFLFTSESVVFRKVGEEVIVIHLSTGQMFHFTLPTKDFLEFFRKPKRLESFVRASGLADQPEEIESLRGLTQFLLDKKIFETSALGEEVGDEKPIQYSRPGLIRLDETTLEHIAFLEP